MTVHEPATLLTDYLLTALGIGLAWQLHRQVSPGNPAARWWICALLAMSAAAFVGGSYHGFAPNFPPAVAAAWWKLVLWIICFLGLGMGLSLVREIVPAGHQSRWDRFLAAKFMLSVAVIAARPEFFVAMIDYGLAMIAWAVAALRFRRVWSGWMLAAVGFSALAGWGQQSGWSIPGRLNHNDLYHLIQSLALAGVYRAGRLLGGLTNGG